jgi:hypothetical protein
MAPADNPRSPSPRPRGRTFVTAAAFDGSADSLVVTHPFHPLCGRRVDVLRVCRYRAGRRYVCDGGALGRLTLPEDATDRGPAPGERPLSIEVLGALVAVVADLSGERAVAR